MKLDLIGGPSSGKSTISALLAQLMAEIGKKRGAPRGRVLGIATTTGAAPHLEAAGVECVRARSLKAVQGQIGSLASGEAAVLDDATEPYLHAVETYLDTANEFRRREAKGADESPNMTPGAWRVVNVRMREATEGEAMRRGVHLVSVIRESEVYMLDPATGRVPGMGIGTRGQSEAGTGADLLIHLHGGLQSKHRYPGDRLLFVVSDLAGLANGISIPLRSIRCARDWTKLRARLKDELGDSIRAALKATDKNRDLWLSLDEERDLWPEAAHTSAEGEKLLLEDEVNELLRRHGMDGQTAAISGERARLMHTCFGVTKSALFKEDPRLTPALIRRQIPVLEELLIKRTEKIRQEEEDRAAEIEAKGKA